MAVQLGQVKPVLGANPAQQKTDLQLQQAAGQMSQAGLTPTKSQIQQTAGQVAQVKGQEQVQQQQKQIQQAQQQRQVQASEQKVQKVKQLMQTKQQIADNQMKNNAALDGLQMNLRQQYVDDVTKFKKDEIGRTVFNARQLSDWAQLKARNEDEYAEYEQMMFQALERKNAVMEHSFKVISQHLDQEYQKAEQARDQEYMKQVQSIRADIARRQAEARKKAASKAAMFSTGGTLLGMGLAAAAIVTTGGVAAPAAAAIIGASGTAGGALGGLTYSQTDTEV